MTLAAALFTLKSANVLSREYKPIAEGARLVLSGTKPVILRFQLQPQVESQPQAELKPQVEPHSGFADFLLSGNGDARLVAIGTGVCEFGDLPRRYPGLFTDPVHTQLLSPGGITALFPEWQTFIFGPGPVRLTPNSRPIWHCEGMQNIQQKKDWCVPTCMSILSTRMFGKRIEPKWFADRWNQGEGALTYGNMYLNFKRFCTDSEMDVKIDFYDKSEAHRMSWDTLTGLDRPMLISLDEHAEVCVGVCSLTIDPYGNEGRGYCVLDPYDKGLGEGWMALPLTYELNLRFAFLTPPAMSCPKPVPA